MEFDGQKEVLPPKPSNTAMGAINFLIQYGECLTHSEVMQLVPCLGVINGLMECKQYGCARELTGVQWAEKTPEIMEVLSYV